MIARGTLRKLTTWSTAAVILSGQAAFAQSPDSGFEEAFAQETQTPAGQEKPVTAPKPAKTVPAKTAPASPAPAVTPKPIKTVLPAPSPTASPVVEPIAGGTVQPVPVVETIMHWDMADAAVLLTKIESIGEDGLFPGDYQPEALRAAMASGDGDALDKAASTSFSWLAEDLRDGRTPMTDRVQWFAVDPDQDDSPTAKLMAAALENHDVAGVLDGLDPTYPDYAALKAELAATPESEKDRRALIEINMDRWRWLKRDLGQVYLITNVPEFQLRFVVNDKIIRTYRTVVGKPGRTATPQLAEMVTAVVFNPTWTVPQSIVKGEGLGAKLLANPGLARAQGYKVTKGADGYVSVVQQPGPNNALGLMKIDMPNPHAIYLHDTPSKQYFQKAVRAYSHGCVRTENAVTLGMTMAIFGAGMSPDEAAAISRSHHYTKVAMTRPMPVYLTYVTMGTDIDGQMRQFDDIYGRDKPVLDSFARPRQLKTSQRASDEAIIKLDNPL